jgi:hypothetical protein
MNRNTFERTVNDQQISQVENQIADNQLYDDALSKASADYYERSWKRSNNDRQLDIWIAVGLLLLLSGVALVVL